MPITTQGTVNALMADRRREAERARLAARVRAHRIRTAPNRAAAWWRRAAK